MAEIIDKLVKRIRPDYDLDAAEEKKWREYVCYLSSLFFWFSSWFLTTASTCFPYLYRVLIARLLASDA